MMAMGSGFRSTIKCLLQVAAHPSQKGARFSVCVKLLKHGAQFRELTTKRVTLNTQSICRRFLSSNSEDGNFTDKSTLKDSETHGQPLHRFGSSVTRESAANRFDVNRAASPATNYQQDIPIDPDIDVYNHTTSVNLSACMQSQVPEPYGKSPTHMNMPGGVSRREDKYVQGQISSLANKREYSAVAGEVKAREAVDEHGNATYMTVSQIMEAPCPQGVQGDDCEQFKLWLSNCLEHGTNADCEKLANEYIADRKTLSQIFDDYELQIKQASTNVNKVGTEHIVMSSSQSERSSSKQDGSSQPTGSTSGHDNSSPLPVTRRARLKAAVRDYGTTVIVFHVAISLASLGLFYTLVASNVNVIGLLHHFRIPVVTATVETASTFVVAYGVHKVFAPVRIGITLTCAPLIVRFLRAKGILKAPKL